MTSPIDRLVLARDYDVCEWMEEAYLAVCQSSEYPSDEDCLRLDPVTIVRIGRAREALRSPGTLVLSERHPEVVRRIFKLQSDCALKGMSTTLGPTEEASSMPSPHCHEAIPTAHSSLPPQDESTPQVLAAFSMCVLLAEDHLYSPLKMVFWIFCTLFMGRR
jgi:hypothetical protein